MRRRAWRRSARPPHDLTIGARAGLLGAKGHRAARPDDEALNLGREETELRAGGAKPRISHDSELSAALVVFAALAAVLVIWIGWRASVPLEINVNEPWNAWHAHDAFAFDRLYPPRGALTLNNYPPLSFIVLHLLAPLFPNAIVAGRALSLLSILLTGAASYACAREIGAERRAAALGALWFVATVIRFLPEYAGMNDPNLLGLAVTAWAFYLFLSARLASTIYVAFFLMAVAGLIKHNLLAVPLAALGYLALTRPGLALRSAVFGGAVCIMLAALALAAYGWSFVDDMTAPRHIYWLRPFATLGHLQWVALVWPFWLVWLRSSDDVRAKRITVTLVVAGFVIWWLCKLGAGVNENVQFELVFATSLCVAVTVGALYRYRLATPLGAVTLSAVFCLALLVRLLAAAPNDPYLLLVSPDFRSAIAERAKIVESEVERVRAIADPVSCSIHTVCYLAGKAYVFDQFSADQQIATGRATREQIAAEESGIRFEPIDPSARWGAQ